MRLLLLGAGLLFSVPVVVLWAMGMDMPAWVGAWFAPGRPYRTGIPLLLLFALAFAWLFQALFRRLLPGPPVIRGVLFGGALAALSIWVAPGLLSLMDHAAGDTSRLYGGNEATEARDESRVVWTPEQDPPEPRWLGVEPPLAVLRGEAPWAAPAAWRGRVFPFVVAFMLGGLCLGLTWRRDDSLD